tara:strand:+ start:2841 stop:3374 length:534 start_codon:yes stop_codon:yes gene_type:complete
MRGRPTFQTREDVPKHQANLETKRCNRCATELIVPTTWARGDVKISNYLCVKCSSKIRKMNKLKGLARSIQNMTVRHYDRQKDGYVYIISNPSWQGWYKVGRAVDAEDRLNSYQTSSPFRDYVLRYSKYFSDRMLAESIAHNNVGKIADQRKGEWFKVSQQDDVVNIIEEIIDETDT